jgi:hypothetical protein
MDKQSRREAVREYKERKAAPGIFAVRCTASGEAWVGTSRNLEQQQNREWFALKQGAHMNRALRAAWRAHGEAAFSFEPLEVVDDEGLSAVMLDKRLKERAEHWREELGATKIAG